MPDDRLVSVPVYLLAGGRSRRFGSDKARVEIDGIPLIVRLARLMQPLAASVTVIAGEAGQYADLGFVTLGDVHPGRGPMAGLHTALRDADEGTWVLVCSCDLLEVRPSWVTTLAEGRTRASRAVAFHELDAGGGRGRWHPFPGLYHQSLLAEVERRLMAGDLRMQHLLRDVATAVALPDDWPDVPQVNTPDDLARAMRSKRGDA